MACELLSLLTQADCLHGVLAGAGQWVCVKQECLTGTPWVRGCPAVHSSLAQGVLVSSWGRSLRNQAGCVITAVRECQCCTRECLCGAMIVRLQT